MFNLDPNVLIIDNFYDDPYAIRKIALESEYYDYGYSNGFPDGLGPFSGVMSKTKFIPKNLDAKLSKLLNKHLYSRNHSDHGYFRITKKNDPCNLTIHSDSCITDMPDNKYVGIVYLSLDEHSKEIPGTILHKHLPTNSESCMDTNHQLELINNNAFHDMSQWEQTFACKFKFNRLFIYPPHKFHSVGKSFGDTNETGRLIQLFSWGEIIG